MRNKCPTDSRINATFRPYAIRFTHFSLRWILPAAMDLSQLTAEHDKLQCFTIFLRQVYTFSELDGIHVSASNSLASVRFYSALSRIKPRKFSTSLRDEPARFQDIKFLLARPGRFCIVVR